MEIRVGDYTYRASQIEKCVTAMVATMDGAPVSLTCMRVDSMVGPRYFHWEALVKVKGGALSSFGRSPWAALCALVSANAKAFGALGITVER
jgi:hypothetical protein